MLPEIVHLLDVIKVSNDTVTINLYIKNYKSLKIISNPFSNASIVNNKLVVKGDFRDLTYKIIIEAYNDYGEASTSVIVQESATHPIILKDIGNIPVLTDNTYKIDLALYFRYYKTLNLILNPYSNAVYLLQQEIWNILF